jgi:hypothetical protein
MVKAADGDECRGLCDYDSLTISVNVAQAHSMVLHTFLHEKMHAMLWTIGSDKADDEGFVDALSGILAQGMLTASDQV